MPDTGSPWNIPYVENADLVRDWPADSLLVANAVAAGLSAAGNAGIGSNVVQTVKTDTFTTTSATFADVTGMSVSITPSSATSKVLLICQFNYGVQPDRGALFKMLRGSTDIYVGAASSSRIQGAAGGYLQGPTQADNFTFNVALVFVDSPGVASATTYKLQTRRASSAATVSVNRSHTDPNSANGLRSASSITAIEVAA